MTEFSKPLEELPTFLATISMVGDEEREIIGGLKQAERKSPAKYGPAKQIFCRILSGDISYQFGLDQAIKIPDLTERNCAVSVLRASRQFLLDQDPGRLIPLPFMTATLRNGIELKVGPIWLRGNDDQRLLVLHVWRRPLTPRQLSAAGSILRLALLQNKPQYATMEIDFITVSIPDGASSRRLVNYGWKRLILLTESELLKFSQQIARAWYAYKRIGPRAIKRRPNGRGLFS